jgi:hypothetical protein
MRALLMLLLAAAAAPAAAQSMAPGNWKFTSSLTSPMLPKPQVAEVTRCLTKQEAEDPTHFSSQDMAQGCSVTPGVRTASSFAWTVSCPGQGLKGAGTLHFARGTVESVVRMVMEQQGQKIEMLSKTSGRLLGPCTAK